MSDEKVLGIQLWQAVTPSLSQTHTDLSNRALPGKEILKISLFSIFYISVHGKEETKREQGRKTNLHVKFTQQPSGQSPRNSMNNICYLLGSAASECSSRDHLVPNPWHQPRKPKKGRRWPLEETTRALGGDNPSSAHGVVQCGIVRIFIKASGHSWWLWISALC